MKDPAASALVMRIKSDMIDAMKTRDQMGVAARKLLLGSIANAEAVPNANQEADGSTYFAGTSNGVGTSELPRQELSKDDILGIIRAEIEEMTDVLRSLDAANDYAAELRRKIELLQQYL